MLNIVVPMAGRGSRFASAGYAAPKPLIRFGGKPMIQWVIENVRPACDHRFIFICLAEHLTAHAEIPRTLHELAPGCEIVPVDAVTEGAACTVLLARQFIDNSDALMVANSDQFVELQIDEYLAELDRQAADGLIMTFEANDPKWSYCKMRADGTVAEVVEKQVVSNEATVGIYNFRHGADYVRAADEMIDKNLRVNGEFYVAPTYNQLIDRGARIVVARTGKEYEGMFGLGIPPDLQFFMTTAAFANNCAPGTPRLSKADVVNNLTCHYAACISAKNLRGLDVLLTEESTLADCNGTIYSGRTAIVECYRQFFQAGIFSGGAEKSPSQTATSSGVVSRTRQSIDAPQWSHSLHWSDHRISAISLCTA